MINSAEKFLAIITISEGAIKRCDFNDFEPVLSSHPALINHCYGRQNDCQPLVVVMLVKHPMHIYTRICFYYKCIVACNRFNLML